MEPSKVEMITEWNIQRIAWVLFVLLLLVIVSAYYLSDLGEWDNAKIEKISVIKQPIPLKQETIKEVFSQTPKEILIKEIPIVDSAPFVRSTDQQQEIMLIEEPALVTSELFNPHILRAQLAQGVSDKEPYGQVNLPVIVTAEKAEGLFYFTEIMNMKGFTVLHEWLFQDEPVYQRNFIIRGDRWRISTSKLFDNSYIGPWQVRTVTQQGDILHKIDFLVEKG